MEVVTRLIRQGVELSVEEAGITFFDPGRAAGLRKLGLRVRVGGTFQDVRYESAAGQDRLEAVGRLGSTGVQCRTVLEAVKGIDAVTVAHTLINGSDVEAVVADAETGQFAPGSAIRLGKLHMYDARYCHTDNVRTERFPYFQPEYPYVRMLPVEPVLLGAGEDQPLPALYLTDRKYSVGVVAAAAGQERTVPLWRFRRAPGSLTGGLFAEYRMLHEFPQAGAFRLPPGGRLELDGTFYQLLSGTHPQDAFADYLQWLSQRLPMRGPGTPLLDTALYCSWNYGRFSEQYEDKLLRTARFMAQKLPNIRYFLMDAGYQRRMKVPGLNHAHLSGFYPDPGANYDPEKFPRGIRHYSDEVRKLGLRPGIWWSPTVVPTSPLAIDHPDWLLRDAAGQVVDVGASTFLDLSVPEARDFVDRVLGVILAEWGMDALKMDFWSQGFETRSARLRRANTTSIDTRTALFEIIRKHLPPDGGVFMTCVAVGMGNPFIARHADTYRNSQDIGAGVWDEQVHACEWSLPTLGLCGRQTFLLNADGLGANLACPDNENFLRLTWGFITMGMLEIDGILEDLPERYVAALRKLTDRCDRGYRCRCADEAAFTGVPLPAALYVDYPAGSRTRSAGVRQSVALFNWSDEPRMICLSRRNLGQEGPVRAADFWTGRQETWDGEFLSRRLDGRSALLYDVLE